MFSDDLGDRAARSQPHPDPRLQLVLLALRNGWDRERTARELTSHRGMQRAGASDETVRNLQRAALDRLLKAVLSDRPPAGLPAELWPPPGERRAIRELASSGASWRLQVAALKRWLLPVPE